MAKRTGKAGQTPVVTCVSAPIKSGEASLLIFRSDSRADVITRALRQMTYYELREFLNPIYVALPGTGYSLADLMQVVDNRARGVLK